jgi:hypothetical protein
VFQAEFVTIFFFQYWGMNSGFMPAKQVLYHLSHSTSPVNVYVLDIFEIWSCKLFAQAGFEIRSYLSLLPE